MSTGAAFSPKSPGGAPIEVSPTAAGAALLAFSDPAVCRASRLRNVLSDFGRVLQDSTGSAETYQLSHQVDQIDTFISHNWAISRTWKFLALVVHFNFDRAFITALIMLAGSLMSIAIAGDRLFPLQSSLLMTCTFLSVLFLGHRLDSFPFGCRDRVVFLDKTCIHQTDAQLMRQGIENLSAFVANSRELLMCYSDIYLRKLWTVYEVATIVILRRTEDMSIVPIERPFVVMTFIICGYMRFMISRSLTAATGMTAYEPILEHVPASMALYASIAVTTHIMVTVILVHWEQRQRDVEEAAAAFDIHEAKCAVDSDRSLVLKNCLVLMRQQQLVPRDMPDGEVLEVFNNLVRRELPRAIRASLGSAGVPYKVLCVSGLVSEVLDQTLVEVGHGSISPVDGLRVLVGFLGTMLCAVPLTVYLAVHLEKRFHHCAPCAVRCLMWTLVQTVSTLIASPGTPPIRYVIQNLKDSWSRFFLMCVHCSILALLTWLAYRHKDLAPALPASRDDQEQGRGALESVQERK